MKELRTCFLLLPLFALLGVSCILVEKLPDPNADRADHVLQRWIGDTSPGAAVAVVRDGEIAFLRGYGMANLEYDVPITPSTVFHVASLSKQFTAFAILILEQQGKLSLDDNIRDFLEYLPDFEHPITIRHLIRHESGLRDQWELLLLAGWRLDDVITQDHIIRLLSRQKELNFEPGTEFMYSNSGYTLLAEIVGSVTGRPFSEWTREEIFLPLGMIHTRFIDTHDAIIPGRAYSYLRDFSGEYRQSHLNYANVGATSLATTAEDMARWMIHFELGTPGGNEIVKRMTERHEEAEDRSPGYSYALFHDDYRGVRRVYHSGADAAFNSFMAYYPSEKLGIAVMSNTTSFNSAWMAQFLTEIWLGDRLEPFPEHSSDGQDQPAVEEFTYYPLEEYAGRFFSPELDTYYHIHDAENHLMVEYRNKENILLVPAGTDRFSAAFHTYLGRLPQNYIQFRFERNEKGEVSGFRIDSSRILNLAFERTD